MVIQVIILYFLPFYNPAKSGIFTSSLGKSPRKSGAAAAIPLPSAAGKFTGNPMEKGLLSPGADNKPLSGFRPSFPLWVPSSEAAPEFSESAPPPGPC